MMHNMHLPMLVYYYMHCIYSVFSSPKAFRLRDFELMEILCVCDNFEPCD
jgi:hypothetical protein